MRWGDFLIYAITVFNSVLRGLPQKDAIGIAKGKQSAKPKESPSGQWSPLSHVALSHQDITPTRSLTRITARDDAPQCSRTASQPTLLLTRFAPRARG